MKKITKFLIPVAIVFAGFLIAQGLYSIDKNKIPDALSPEKAAEKTIDFINQVALNGQATASLLEISEGSGIYKIQIKVEGEKYEFFVTKDGKLLFSQATEISQEPDLMASEEFPKTDIPEVQLFVMSFCPFGNEAEELIMPVIDLIGDKTNIQLRYIVSESSDGGYVSLHGEQELHQDIRELCVQKYDKDKFWDFIEEINVNCNYQDVDSCWENIAKKIEINIQKIKTCQEEEGLNNLAIESELSQKYAIKGSPQLMINGIEYTGSRTSEGYKNAICSAFNSMPEECSQVLGDGNSSASGNCE